MPGIYDPDFIAANQDSRADNTIKGSRSEQVEQIRQHIRQFKDEEEVEKVNSGLSVDYAVHMICHPYSKQDYW